MLAARHGAVRPERRIQPVIEPDLLTGSPYGLQRDVPADIREFHAERYNAARRR